MAQLPNRKPDFKINENIEAWEMSDHFVAHEIRGEKEAIYAVKGVTKEEFIFLAVEEINKIWQKNNL